MTQQEFNRIKSGEQTILLEKIYKLDNLFNDYDSPNFENGRFKIYPSDEEFNLLSQITINGYSIIKNPFKYSFNKNEDKLHQLFCGNTIWILDNWDQLKQQFQNEDEILVLNIERVE